MWNGVYKTDNMFRSYLAVVCILLIFVNHGGCENDSSKSSASALVDARPRRMYYVCPPDFIRLGSSCYFFSSTEASWKDAHFNCKDRDSSLTSPQRWEDRNLREYLNKPEVERHERWIGGIYDWEAKSWKWGRDMKDMQYQSFSRMRKLSPESLRWHCVAMVPEMLYRWAPQSCILKKHYICQAPLRKVRRTDRNKLREKWNANGNGHKPNEIPAPTFLDHDIINNLNPDNELSANPYVNPGNIQVNYGHSDNNVTPRPTEDNPKAYDLKKPDSAFAHRPKATKKPAKGRRRKPFKGYVYNKDDPEAAYLHNVNALKSGKTGLSNAQIEKHLLRLERLRKKEEMQKMKRERMKDRQNRQRNKQRKEHGSESKLSLAENKLRERNVANNLRENGIMQDDNKIKTTHPRKSSHSIEHVTQKTYIMNNQISELHPKTIVEVHDFSNE